MKEEIFSKKFATVVLGSLPESFNRLVELVAVAVAVVDFRISSLMLSLAGIIVINTEV